MKIIEEFYYWQDSLESNTHNGKNLLDKELAMYDIIMSKLNDEDQRTFIEYSDCVSARQSEDLLDTYVKAFKTGLRMGVEANDIDGL